MPTWLKNQLTKAYSTKDKQQTIVLNKYWDYYLQVEKRKQE